MSTQSRRGSSRWGFTLVEMLVVIAIIGLLVSMLLPAIAASREKARQAVCQSNLRSFGQMMHSYAVSHNGAFCSGAFDWIRDGAVTEIGWVADSVNGGAIPGKMLCPSNQARLSATYADLFNFSAGALSGSNCVPWKGSEPKTLPDGTLQTNACYKIMHTSSMVNGPSEERKNLVISEIFNKGYNTNYTASWFLVRGGVSLDDSGNARANPASCYTPSSRGNFPDLTQRAFCMGPLKQAYLDSSKGSSSTVPILGDGGLVSASANIDFDDIVDSGVMAGSMTAGPVISDPAAGPVFTVPVFANNTPKTGSNGWWAKWYRQMSQDYRAFGFVHKDQCNMLFADGHVSVLNDRNNDGKLNVCDQYKNIGFHSAEAVTRGEFSNSESDASPQDILPFFSIDAVGFQP